MYIACVEIRSPSDPLKREPELVCMKCNETLCDVEAGECLKTLVDVARDHDCAQREVHVPGCDGDACASTAGELRSLPTTHGNAILCRDCFDSEMEYRKDLNEERAAKRLEPLDVPTWESLKVYARSNGTSADDGAPTCPKCGSHAEGDAHPTDPDTSINTCSACGHSWEARTP